MKNLLIRPFALMLLGLLAACGSVATPGPGSQPLPGSAIPPELQGAWCYGSISLVDYYDPVTGVWGAPSGTGISFTLDAGGNYERSSLLQITTYGCESYVFIWELGTALLSGDQITFQSYQSAVKSQVCSPADVSEEHNTVESETFTWSVGPDDYGETVLTLTYPSGEEILYDRPN